MEDVRNVPAVLLVGGKGTRLRSVVPSTPKPLAVVGKRPFLELVVRQLGKQGVRNLVMSTGHLAEQIEAIFGDGGAYGVEIAYSKEATPLGTGGAVKVARRLLSNAPDFLVMNGDSFLEIDFVEFIHFHRERRGIASMAVRQVPNTGRYGTVRVDSQRRVTAFSEKTGQATPGLVNAGIYLFSDKVFDYVPDGPVSLENGVFPKMLEQNVYALEQHGMFIDIGTPEDYARAQELSESLSQIASGCGKS